MGREAKPKLWRYCTGQMENDKQTARRNRLFPYSNQINIADNFKIMMSMMVAPTGRSRKISGAFLGLA